MKGYTNKHKKIGIGNRFLIDFGCVHGPVPKGKEKVNIVSSFDVHSFYLLITDEDSRYIWVFLTKDKTPPIEIVNILEHHGLKEGMRRICTDQGGEVAKSSEFLINKHKYILEVTGSDASFQKGMAKRPHCVYGEIMRTMLMTTGLPNTYRIYSIIEAYTGGIPNLAHL